MKMCRDPWIIDSGATDHMTNNLNLLHSLSNVHDPVKSNVHLPNGKTVPVSYQGRCNITGGYTIRMCCIYLTSSIICCQSLR